MGIVITNGRVVTSTGDSEADVRIQDGVIDAVGRDLIRGGDDVIDASGRYVLPGCVDPHTHMEMPFGGTVSCDDFTSGTTSAAFGGTTCIVDFCIQAAGQPIPAALDMWHAKLAKAPPLVDVGFHLAVTDLSAGDGINDLKRLPEAGVTSLKLFMAYKGTIMVDDDTLFRTMLAAADSGCVAMVHAENGDVIDILIHEALAAGHTDPKWHEITRPVATEAEATNRAIALAEVADCPLYVVHVSCVEALNHVVSARRRNRPVWAETCTQYLFRDRSDLDRPDFEGAKFVFTPPPRTEIDRDALWRAIARRDLAAVTSDHCPFTMEQKALGRDDFSKIPNGAPGVEHRLQMLHHFGVRSGRLSMSRMVELVATNPARLFGLYPRKGVIASGSDADIVLFDAEKTVRIGVQTHHSRIDYNTYEGTDVKGTPTMVMVRGNVIIDGDRLVAHPGAGRFVKRGPFVTGDAMGVS